MESFVMAYFRRGGDLPDWIPEPHKGHIRSWIYPPKRMTAYVRPHGKML
jgi:hypothetical protein